MGWFRDEQPTDLAKLCERVGVPEHPDTLVSQSHLAESYRALGRFDEAVKPAGESYALLKAKLGPDHPQTLWSAAILARCDSAVGRNSESAKLDEETPALQKRKLGDDHPVPHARATSAETRPSRSVSTRNLNRFLQSTKNHRLMGATAWLVPDSHTFFDARFSYRELNRFVRIALD